MIKKILRNTFSFFTALFVIICALLIVAIGAVQTEGFKKKLASVIEEKAKREGLEIHIGTISGMAPLNFSLSDATLTMNDGSSISLEKIRIRISLSDLLRNKLTISYLSIDKVSYHFTKPSMTWQELCEIELKLPKIPPLPFSIASLHVAIKGLYLWQEREELPAALCVIGKAKIKNDLSEILVSVKITSHENPNVYTHITIDGSEKKGSLEATTELFIPSCKLLYPLVDLPFDGKMELTSRCKGTWPSWKRLVFGGTSIQGPISLTLAGRADHLVVPSHPYLDSDWKVKGDFLIFPSDRLECKALSVESPFIAAQSTFTMLHGGRVEDILASFTASDMQPFSSLVHRPLQGAIQGQWNYSTDTAHLTLTSDRAFVCNVEVKDLRFEGCGSKKNEAWTGDLDLSLKAQEELFSFTAGLRKENDIVYLDNILAKGAGLTMDARALCDMDKKQVDTSLFIEAPNLSTLRPLLGQQSSISGSMSLSSDIKYDLIDSAPTFMRGHLLAKNARYYERFIGALGSSFTYENRAGMPTGNMLVEADNILLPSCYLSKIKASTEENGNTHPFKIEMEGIWKKEGKIKAIGTWHKQDDDYIVQLKDASALISGHTVSLQNPCKISWGRGHSAFSDISFSVGEGQLAAGALFSQDRASINTHGKHIPLDMLLPTDKTVYLSGLASFDGALNIEKDKNTGYFNLALESAELSQGLPDKELKAKGSLQAHLDMGTLQLFTHLYATNEQFLDMTLTAPLTISPHPFSMQMDTQKRMSAELTAEGEVESLFDFINMGAQKASGLITAHLFLSNTLKTPALQGTAHLQNGTYENYAIGTRLKNVEALIEADSDALLLKHLHAKGKEGGELSAEGSIQLKTHLDMPFDIEAKLSNLKFLELNFLSADFTADLNLMGTTKGATLSGHAIAPKVNISLIEELPAKVPELDITYINRPIHLEGQGLISDKPYPLHYDVMIGAKDRVFVKGRGLESEWKGDLHLTGQNSEVAAEGTLSLMKGDFTFAGKKFSLQDGEITFLDKPSPQAFIKMSGNLQLTGLQIIVQIQGPIEKPSFAIHSVPHMPTSALLSRILFNKDISEITAVEALQLANVIVSMSGATGPDVLENIRRSIGVDRLTIVGKEGSDEISLQIGWYLTHGVTVSLSQSATSSDVTVEVDLKHGFIFQAETQNQEEGKFSLKWNKNY